MNNSYIKTPESISIKSIEEKGFTLSSSQYMDLIMPNKNYKLVGDFLSRPLKRSDLGVEVGSLNYISQSPFCFLRTKAFQSYSFLPEITSESALPVMPSVFVKQNLQEGDLLISKDSNIGEIVILDKDYPNFMASSAIYKLPVNEHRYYLLAFIKHQIFREQLDFMVPKGATIRHAKTMFLDCKIPIPNKDTADTMKFVEVLTQAIVNKEKLIQRKHNQIIDLIHLELENNQKNKQFQFEFPTLNELEINNRLDANYYSEKHKSLIFATLNYKNGYLPLTEQGLELKPGPSLEIRLLGTRIDSDKYIKGFYRLITPKQILNNGTVKNYEYIGTPQKIPTIQYGDILFGESGTGRSMVYLDDNNNTINNAHAHILRPIKGKCSLNKAITVRCIMQYYKEIGIIDCITVGGSGGHLSPSYFDRVYIPTFPNDMQDTIANLYHKSDLSYNVERCTLNDFLDTDSKYNRMAGIYELDRTARLLKEKLNFAIDNITNDKSVKIDFEV
jgi:type I restriction enzyme S subunit